MDGSPEGLKPLEIGGGQVDQTETASYTLEIPAMPRGYADAQLDDTQGLPREQLRWLPPVRLRLRARASEPTPLGTLGFGWWNDPFSFSLGIGGAARRLPVVPSALWFFYGSPPNDFSFDPAARGHGWKAAALHGRRIPPLLLAPLAAGALLLSRLPGVRGGTISLVKQTIDARERVLDTPLDSWAEYEIDWEPARAVFRVNGEVVLETGSPPAGPLGFVAWIDNQYAVISPRRGIRFGSLPTAGPQRLEIAGLTIDALTGSGLAG